ncbi:glycosyltransferase [Pokkaliibacter plantistimulans]|uniref:glycosyltransferase n=1 Tax=Pokkaliibacter plantistimulans TaxID=1635171 RepID=UPI000D74AFAE|nr:glycosyltransferase [Pokkaliibacter plantistimulans]
MKIAHVVNRLDGNGVTKAVINLCETLSDRGITSDIIVLEKTEYPLRIDIQLHSLGSSGLMKRQNPIVKYVRKLAKYTVGSLAYYSLKAEKKSAQLDRLIKKEGYTHILLHCHYSKILFSKVKEAKCFPVIHNKKSKHLKATWWLPSWINRHVMSRALVDRSTIAVSKAVRNDLSKYLHVEKHQLSVLPNVINSAAITSLAKLDRPLPAKLIEKQYLLAVGRLAPQKRFDRLLKAYSMSSCELPLVIAGDGIQLKLLQRLARRLRINHRVIFLGHVENPYQLMKHARLLILSSDYEGLPTVLIEALLLHTPVLATACSGAREAVANCKLAKLVPIRKLSVLAESINQYSLHPPTCDECNCMLDHYKPERIIKEFLNLVDYESNH